MHNGYEKREKTTLISLLSLVFQVLGYIAYCVFIYFRFKVNSSGAWFLPSQDCTNVPESFQPERLFSHVLHLFIIYTLTH